MAMVIAERSLCDRDKVGAVVVSRQNRIVDTGYNGPPRGMPREETGCVNWCPRAKRSSLDPAYDDCHALHAEVNALTSTDRAQREGGTIYVSSGVCGSCAKLIANSGLVRVVCDTTHSASPQFAHRSSGKWFAWLTLCGLQVEEMKH